MVSGRILLSVSLLCLFAHASPAPPRSASDPICINEPPVRSPRIVHRRGEATKYPVAGVTSYGHFYSDPSQPATKPSAPNAGYTESCDEYETKPTPVSAAYHEYPYPHTRSHDERPEKPTELAYNYNGGNDDHHHHHVDLPPGSERFPATHTKEGSPARPDFSTFPVHRPGETWVTSVMRSSDTPNWS
ncbi:hypothetical protein BX600DRAFT_177733 [Xylariales sp. PMI_506]|nr:hypothetical protein BX600DRAFT_177733 [Xylariales sp. PMI_506]